MTNVSIAYRVGKSGQGHGPRQIVVKLTTQKKRDEIMRAKRLMREKERSVYINEDLTPFVIKGSETVKKGQYLW